MHLSLCHFALQDGSLRSGTRQSHTPPPPAPVLVVRPHCQPPLHSGGAVWLRPARWAEGLCPLRSTLLPGSLPVGGTESSSDGGQTHNSEEGPWVLSHCPLPLKARLFLPLPLLSFLIPTPRDSGIAALPMG